MDERGKLSTTYTVNHNLKCESMSPTSVVHQKGNLGTVKSMICNTGVLKIKPQKYNNKKLQGLSPKNYIKEMRSLNEEEQ